MGLVERAAKFAGRILPQRFLIQTERRLESTNIALSAEEYSGIALLVSLIAGGGLFLGGFILSLPLPSPIFAVIGFGGAFIALSIFLPYYLAQRRTRELESSLPDALRQMASTLRAGVGMSAAMEDISGSGYGPLSEEFERAVVEIRRGRQMNDALLALARRSNSDLIKRAFRLIVEGIERGAALADVLDSVSKDAREIQTVQRERKAATTQQVMFLMMASIFAAPFIIGLVMEVSGMFGGMGQAAGGGAAPGGMPGAMAGGSQALPPVMGTIAMGFVAIQAIICSLAVGVIRYGRLMKGITFTVPFLLGAVGVYYGARIAAGILL